MKSIRFTIFLLLICGNSIFSQSKPVWDIGTKWTYELFNPPGSYSFVTNEIVDTITIDNLKLYEVLSEPIITGIEYFYFDDSKVYNYNPDSKILQLLYDFEETSSYQTEYRPICDPNFDYDSLSSQNYIIEIDSIKSFQLPNGQSTTIQYAKNEETRRILKKVGFMEGNIHYTHDWELGIVICDEIANFVYKLRCFENDTVSYNFQSYPCDTTWIVTSVDEISKSALEIFPNPTNNNVQIKNISEEIEYELFTLFGQKVKAGKTENGIISLEDAGTYILRMRDGDNWVVEKVIKME